MGLAAAQCRFAMLTSRQNDVESRMMRIANEKLSLSRQSAEASEAYSNALNQEKLVWTGGDTDSSVSYDMFSANSGYYLTNSNGALLLTSADAQNYGIDKSTGNLTETKNAFMTRLSGLDAAKVDAYIKDVEAGKKTETSSTAPIFKVAYSDDDIFKKMSELTTPAGWGAWINGLAKSSDSPSQPNIIEFFNSSGNSAVEEWNTMENQLTTLVTSITNTAASAVQEVIKSNMGNDTNYNKISSYVQKAAEKAQQDTLNWYNGQTDANKIIEMSRCNVQNVANIGCNGKGTDDMYIDATAVTEYFLARFDNYLKDYDGDESTKSNNDKSSSISSVKTEKSLRQYASDHYGKGGSAANIYVVNRDSSKINGTGDKTEIVDAGSSGTKDKNGLTAADRSNLASLASLWTSLNDNGVVINDNIKDSKYLENQILSGNILVLNSSGSVQRIGDASSALTTESDDEMTSEAQAEYQAQKDEIDYKESLLDVEQTDLDTERAAITTEKDSVQKLIDSNVKVFKMFDA